MIRHGGDSLTSSHASQADIHLGPHSFVILFVSFVVNALINHKGH
jgi:hypothetical protein